MSADRLIVRGAREHNLKNVSLDLPRNAMIVFTGLSGSGKSSLAFDTIFAEGQRRSSPGPTVHRNCYCRRIQETQFRVGVRGGKAAKSLA